MSVIWSVNGLNDRNCFGLVVSPTGDGTFMPIMCGCGGSMFLCRRHAEEMIATEKARQEPTAECV